MNIVKNFLKKKMMKNKYIFSKYIKQQGLPIIALLIITILLSITGIAACILVSYLSTNISLKLEYIFYTIIFDLIIFFIIYLIYKDYQDCKKEYYIKQHISMQNKYSFNQYCKQQILPIIDLLVSIIPLNLSGMAACILVACLSTSIPIKLEYIIYAIMFSLIILFITYLTYKNYQDCKTKYYQEQKNK